MTVETMEPLVAIFQDVYRKAAGSLPMLSCNMLLNQGWEGV